MLRSRHTQDKQQMSNKSLAGGLVVAAGLGIAAVVAAAAAIESASKKPAPRKAKPARSPEELGRLLAAREGRVMATDAGGRPAGHAEVRKLWLALTDHPSFTVAALTAKYFEKLEEGPPADEEVIGVVNRDLARTFPRSDLFRVCGQQACVSVYAS